MVDSSFYVDNAADRIRDRLAARYLCVTVRGRMRNLISCLSSLFLYHNQAEYEIKGFRLFDHVSYKGWNHYFIYGRRKTGFFDIRLFDGTGKVNSGSVSSKKIHLIQPCSGYLVDRFVVSKDNI